MIYKKLVYVLVAVLFLLFVLFLYRLMTVREIDEKLILNPPATTTQIVYDQIELKNQNDFKMVGKVLYRGSGFEPGFAFEIALAGNKFGVDLTSQYGETRYVGYLDLVGQSTSTKAFGGKVLDKQNKIVDAQFLILNQVCTMPSGEDVPYTVNIKAGDENLSGCAELLN